MSTQPFNAPKHAIAPAAAKTSAAAGPQSARAASENGAPDAASVAAGTSPSTTVHAPTVTAAATIVPIHVARGTVRAGSRTDSAGTVAHSSPRNAQSVSAAVVSASPMPLPVAVGGRESAPGSIAN